MPSLGRGKDACEIFPVLRAHVAAHFRLSVMLGDQPRGDTGRHLAHDAGDEAVELYAIEFRKFRLFRDADFHFCYPQQSRCHATQL